MSSSTQQTLSIAPMIQWTDTNWRYLFRHITRKTLLYTEMTMDGTLLHQRNDLKRFLGHTRVEHPLVLQLGGSDPALMSEAGYIAESFAQYHSININCGCPSTKAKKAGFGAELMLDPDNTAEIVRALKRKVTHTDITVKCRLGILPDHDSYEELQHFITSVHQAGADSIIMHARNCILTGLTPAQNRSIPPLRYDLVHRLVAEYPDIDFYLNGGLTSFEQCEMHMGIGLESDSTDDVTTVFNSLSLSEEQRAMCKTHPVKGCMVGRQAYKDPWMFATADSRFFNSTDPGISRGQALNNYIDYCQVLCDSSSNQTSCHDVPDSIDGGVIQAVDALATLTVNDKDTSDDDSDRDLLQIDRAYEPKMGNYFNYSENLKPLHNFFNGCPGGSTAYKRKLDALCVEATRRRKAINSSETGKESGRMNPEEQFEVFQDIMRDSLEGTISNEFLEEIPC